MTILSQPITQPPWPRCTVLPVTVPHSCAGGDSIQVHTPGGVMKVVIPPGLGAGQVFEVQVPAQQLQRSQSQQALRVNPGRRRLAPQAPLPSLRASSSFPALIPTARPDVHLRGAPPLPAVAAPDPSKMPEGDATSVPPVEPEKAAKVGTVTLPASKPSPCTAPPPCPACPHTCPLPPAMRSIPNRRRCQAGSSWTSMERCRRTSTWTASQINHGEPPPPPPHYWAAPPQPPHHYWPSSYRPPN